MSQAAGREADRQGRVQQTQQKNVKLNLLKDKMNKLSELRKKKPPRSGKLLWRLAHRRVLIDHRLRAAYTIELHKQREQDKFGLEGLILPDDDGCSLQIMEVPHTGLVALWNRHHRQKLRRHARIMNVNGETIPMRMQAIIHTSDSVRMQVCNPELPHIANLATITWKRRRAIQEEARIRLQPTESAQPESKTRTILHSMRSLFGDEDQDPPLSPKVTRTGSLTYADFIKKHSIGYKVAFERFQHHFLDLATGGGICCNIPGPSSDTSATRMAVQDLLNPNPKVSDSAQPSPRTSPRSSPRQSKRPSATAGIVGIPG